MAGSAGFLCDTAAVLGATVKRTQDTVAKHNEREFNTHATRSGQAGPTSGRMCKTESGGYVSSRFEPLSSEDGSVREHNRTLRQRHYLYKVCLPPFSAERTKSNAV